MIRRNMHIIRVLLIYLVWTLYFNGCGDIRVYPEYEFYLTKIQEVEYSQTDRLTDGTYDVTKNWLDQHTSSTAIEDITVRCQMRNTGWVPIDEYCITVTIFYELGDFDIFYQNESGVQPGYNSNSVIFIDNIRFEQCIEKIKICAELGWLTNELI